MADNTKETTNKIQKKQDTMTKEQKREKILEQLAEGEIDADTAVARLNEIKGEK